MIKKTVIFLLFIFIPCQLLFAQSAAKPINEFDGTDWQGWDVNKKGNFIAGFMSACAYIYEKSGQDSYYTENFDHSKYTKSTELFIDLFLNSKKKKQISRDDVLLLLDNQKADKNLRMQALAIFGIAINQITQGLNELYVDFKNRQIKITNAIYVVKKQINGSPPEEIEALLQYLRASAAGNDTPSMFYIDKTGEKKHITFP